MEITERYEHINLFDGLEELSIFHISDVHLWYSTAILGKLKTLIATHKPDLIALTGDYYDLPIGAHNFRKFLIEVSREYTIVFIKGNHDRLYGRRISNLLSGIPNCFDVEEYMYKYRSKKGFCYNITSWKNRVHLPCNSQEKNIVLIHNPEKIKTEELSNIQLILAGHLHGGQFIFFRTKDNSNFPACLLYKHCADRKQIMDTTLIVSRGLGDTFPFRFNCPKEIVKITVS
ncbi:metallophosphoesterase [Pedobacter frigoris]|uniref:metallophosphoesterase n=1 Tax=Pedobacter frigoris TaxID=2571272 RepID=UPI002930ED72|nr:metallophosphoesterase [Pedobacter frigoris]